jgi:hypothetical protein
MQRRRGPSLQISTESAFMTSSTLTVQNVIHPFTGETFDLSVSTTDDLASFLTEVREYESRLKEAKRIVTDETLRRLDERASWTLRTPDYTLKAPSPAPGEEWDEIALRSDLWQLVDDGVITEDAAGAAVETVVSYKVKTAGVNALRKLGGRVAETVNRHCREVEKRRYVTVTRNHR